MSLLTSDNLSLTTQSGDIRVLGETGQTVVYLFPDGRAIPERETPDFDALSPAISERSVLNDLVAQGKMSCAQKLVVLHDHEVTGMGIMDILSARGWL